MGLRPRKLIKAAFPAIRAAVKYVDRNALEMNVQWNDVEWRQ